MSFVVDRPERHAGRVIADGHCVRFVQEVGELPHTARWRPGKKARDGDLPLGTVIATFDPNGRYGNHTDGRSHAAVFVERTAEGLLVWDQWLRHPVAQRVIRFRGGQGRKVNDGDQFHVVETEESLFAAELEDLDPPPVAA
jgi:hypothetical protein